MSFDLNAFAKRFGVTPQPIAPQKRPTSRPFRFGDRHPVRLLTGPYNLPVAYTKACKPRKVQPKPIQPGATVYAKMSPGTGEVHLYPFSLAGAGYELVKDAEEGVHYEFLPE